MQYFIISSNSYHFNTKPFPDFPYGHVTHGMWPAVVTPRQVTSEIPNICRQDEQAGKEGKTKNTVYCVSVYWDTCLLRVCPKPTQTCGNYWENQILIRVCMSLILCCNTTVLHWHWAIKVQSLFQPLIGLSRTSDRVSSSCISRWKIHDIITFWTLQNTYLVAMICVHACNVYKTCHLPTMREKNKTFINWKFIFFTKKSQKSS